MLKARPHQEEAIKALSDPAEPRVWTAMACATGKTLVGRRAAYARARDGVIVVFAPSKRLTREHCTNWERDTPDGLDSLIVYSDPGGVTDPEAIAAFLTGPGSGRQRVIFSTYQSADRIHEAFRLRPATPPVDVMVLDEAHVTASMSSLGYGRVLLDTFIPARARISLTATPRVHVQPEDGTTNVVSMSDPALYGPCRYQLSFARAIDGFLINDFRIVVITVTDAEVHRLLADIEGAEDLPSSVLASQVAVAYAVKDFGLRSVLAFHNRVERSRAYTRTLEQVASKVGAGQIHAYSMDADTPAAERDRLLQKLARPGADSAVVLSSVATISEGVDVPEIDAVQFADPRTGRAAIAQAVGRALRRSPGKVSIQQPDENSEAALVILPVYLPPGGSAEEILASSKFSAVWTVLAALRDFDERLDSELTKKTMKNVRRSVELPSQLEVRKTGMDALPSGLADRLNGALEAHLMTLGNRRKKHPPVNKDNLFRLVREWTRLLNERDAFAFESDVTVLRYEVALEMQEAVGGNLMNPKIPPTLWPYVGSAFQLIERYEKYRQNEELPDREQVER